MSSVAGPRLNRSCRYSAELHKKTPLLLFSKTVTSGQIAFFMRIMHCLNQFSRSILRNAKLYSATVRPISIWFKRDLPASLPAVAWVTFGKRITPAILLLQLLLLGDFAHAAETFWGRPTGMTQSRLDSPISATWDQQSLREMLDRLSRAQQMPIILDRDFNADLVATLQFQQTPLETILLQIAGQSHSRMQVLGTGIWFGPTDRGNELRTRITLAIQATEALAKQRKVKGTPSLAVKQGWPWKEGVTLKQVIEQIAAQGEFRITNPEDIPHDLWATQSWPPMHPSAALTIALCQYNLTWEWSSFPDSVTIKPQQPVAQLRREYSATSEKQKQVVAMLEQAGKTISIEQEARSIVITGLVEDHELVQSLLSGTRAKKGGTAVPLSVKARRFSLKARNVSLKLVLDELAAGGIEFQCKGLPDQPDGSPNTMLMQEISVDVVDLPGQQFFEALLKGTRLSFKLDGLTVELASTGTE